MSATLWPETRIMRCDVVEAWRCGLLEEAGVGDVAIVGGGPCGLAAAHALAKVLPPSKSIALYEREPAPTTPRGAGTGLDVNGLKALRAICPGVLDTLLERHAGVMEVVETRNPRGEVLERTDLAPVYQACDERFGGHAVPLGWWEVVATLAEQLPARVQVHHDTKFLRYEEQVQGGQKDTDGAAGTGGGVGDLTLYFQGLGGEAGATEVSAGLLVGCDGYFSRVRRQCVGDGPPVFAGTVVWRARVEAERTAELGYPPTQTVWYVGGDRIIVVYTIGPGHVVWTVFCPEAGVAEAGIDWRAVAESRRKGGESREAAKARLLRVLTGFDPQVQRLLAATAPDAILESAIYVRPASDITPEWWGRGNVVVLGDAAHPMRPMGQGVNMAFEDALLLARALKGWGEGEGGGGAAGRLEAFRTRRAERVKPVVTQAEATGRAAFQRDPSLVSTFQTRTQKQQQQQAAVVAAGQGGGDRKPLVGQAAATAAARPGLAPAAAAAERGDSAGEASVAEVKEAATASAGPAAATPEQLAADPSTPLVVWQEFLFEGEDFSPL